MGPSPQFPPTAPLPQFLVKEDSWNKGLTAVYVRGWDGFPLPPHQSPRHIAMVIRLQLGLSGVCWEG